MTFIQFFQNRTKNFWLFEASTTLFFIGNSITSIFIPIILLKTGFSVKDVIFYYIIFHFLDVVFNFLAKATLEKLGAKKLYFIGVIFNIIFYLFYAFFLKEVDWGILILMATFSALFDSFFYNAYYYLIFATTEKIENVKTNNIIVNTLINFSYLVGPLIGSGIILFTENDKILFYVSLLFFTFSLFPLLFYKTKYKIKKHPLKFKDFFNDKTNKRNFFSWALYKIIETSEWVIFPIYIFLIFQKLDNIAYISIISTLAIFITTFVSGSVKRENRKKIIILGALHLTFLWLLRIFVSNEFLLYLSVALAQIFLIFIFIPLDTNIFRHSEEIDKPVLTAFYKNTISMFSKMIFYILVFILLNFFEIQNIFWIVIFFLLALVLINKKTLFKLRF